MNILTFSLAEVLRNRRSARRLGLLRGTSAFRKQGRLRKGSRRLNPLDSVGNIR